MQILDEQIKRQSDFDEIVKLKLERAQFVEDKIGAIKEALEYAEQESVELKNTKPFIFAKLQI